MWVARNPDGKYHLFDIKPEYDDWYRAWGNLVFIDKQMMN